MSVKFRKAMPIGSKWKIDHGDPITIRPNVGPASTFQPIGGVRTVVEHRSKGMGLEMSETNRPGRDGVVSWLNYPKAHFWKQNEDGTIDIMHSEGERVGTRLLRYTPYEG